METATILLVDDQGDDFFALELLLARDDRNIVKAGDGKQALGAVSNQEIDLIILNIPMPGVDGYEVARTLKSDKRSRDIPILLCIAGGCENPSAMKSFEEDDMDYLYKPLNTEMTEAKVSLLLRLRFQRKELVRKGLALERSQLLINNSADLICVINAGTLKIEEANLSVESILGYTAAEFTGSSLLYYMEGEDRADVEKLSAGEKESFSFEGRFYGRDRVIKRLHWDIVPRDGLWFASAREVKGIKEGGAIKNNLSTVAGGELTSAAIIQRDMTGQEIVELRANLADCVAKLESANNDLESFSYSVSHDLRAPLRAVNAYSQIILDEYSSQFDQELKRLFLVIKASSKKMDCLINDLLTFVRMGKRAVKKVALEFDKQVRQVISEVEGRGKIKATIVIHPMKSTEADAALTYQVWMNLISNAIKYSGKRAVPFIEIGFAESASDYIYSVKDNGTGFNMADAHKLFGVFKRLHDDKDFEGTGIGLAIVKRIIAKHGGTVWAEGEPDKGATFYFSLPKAAAPDRAG